MIVESLILAILGAIIALLWQATEANVRLTRDLFNAAVAEHVARLAFEEKRLELMLEFAALWNYGAHEEAVEVIKAAGFPVKETAE